MYMFAFSFKNCALSLVASVLTLMLNELSLRLKSVDVELTVFSYWQIPFPWSSVDWNFIASAYIYMYMYLLFNLIIYYKINVEHFFPGIGENFTVHHSYLDFSGKYKIHHNIINNIFLFSQAVAVIDR